MMRPALILAFVLGFFSAEAQRDHIVTFREKLVLTAVMNTKSESFDFTSRIGQELEYSTTDIIGLGVGIDYKWFTFEFSKRLNSKSLDGQYGHTENFGLGFGITMPKWYFRNFMEYYTGYHLTNPDFVNINYLDSVGMYPYRPDIGTFRYYASWNWVFNSENYSSMASLWQLERQEKSAGSLVAGMTYTLSGAFGDSAFIPHTQEANFPKVKDWNTLANSAMAVNVGYQYTFVLSKNKKWFLHLGLTPGVGVSWASALAENSSTEIDLGSRALLTTEGRFIIGYNGDDWYFGMSSIGYSTAAASEDYIPISSFNSYNRFYVGYRFSLPKKVTNTLEKIGL